MINKSVKQKLSLSDNTTKGQIMIQWKIFDRLYNTASIEILLDTFG